MYIRVTNRESSYGSFGALYNTETNEQYDPLVYNTDTKSSKEKKRQKQNKKIRKKQNVHIKN
jgi:hypothetical protein